jgi:uracil-DNA glycosylase
MKQLREVEQHIANIQACQKCTGMVGPVITPKPIVSKIYLCGQAPGPHEGKFGRPFAWTAGKTLFSWFSKLGIDEETFRSRVYIGAVCRCFPGKTNAGGDRVPSREEIAFCSEWMQREFTLFKPDLVIAVGKIAIERFLPPAALTEIIGKQHRVEAFGHACDLIPLPHPSGASPWFKIEPGKTLLQKALDLIERHPAWKQIVPL